MKYLQCNMREILTQLTLNSNNSFKRIYIVIAPFTISQFRYNTLPIPYHDDYLPEHFISPDCIARSSAIFQSFNFEEHNISICPNRHLPVNKYSPCP